MSDATPRLVLTPSLVGFFLSIVAVLTLGWNTASYFKNIEQKNIQQDIRLDQSEKDSAKINSSVTELSKQTSDLKEAVVRLTTVIESSPTKRAELIIPKEIGDTSPLLRIDNK